MKSQKFIFACIGVLFCFFFTNCSATGSMSPTVVQTQNLIVTNERVSDAKPDTEKTKTLDCDKPNEYCFVVIDNPNRRSQGTPQMPQDLHIKIGKKVLAKIELPVADSEAKNFSLNSVKKTNEGFEINVEWGGGLYHYEIQFNFNFKKNKFFLYKVKNENFSTTNPDSGNFWDKKETKVTKIEPNLPIEKFVMLDYLQ